MGANEEEFLRMLRATFRVEADEHLQAIATGLLALEKSPAADARPEIVATVFRAAHSLKGAARAVDFQDIESSCQTLEDRFLTWKREGGVPTAAEFDEAHQKLDEITAILSGFGNRPAPSAPGATVKASPGKADERLPPMPAARPTEAVPTTVFPPASANQALLTEPKAAVVPDTVRISVGKLDARLVEAEEMLTAKMLTNQRVDDLREMEQRFGTWHKEWASVEPQARSLAQSLTQPATAEAGFHPGVNRVLEFLEWNRDYLKSLETGVAGLTQTARQDRRLVGKLVDDLLEDSKNLLLLPFATLTAPFPKLVRDLCRDLGKEADLVIHGEDVEVDKRVLEEMKDPLVHLLRNCVDHGVETPDVRVSRGKAARATLTLAVAQVDGSNAEIILSDDGAGLDLEKIKASALKHGLLSEEAARQLDGAAARDLIFQAEVSTAPLITRVSGRGLGMAIVRERVEKLGGTVSVGSQPGAGTRFRIVLPSMLATFRGVLIEAAGRRFVVPTSRVDRVLRVKTEEVKTVEGRETIALGGRAASLVRLAEVLGLPPVAGGGEQSATRTVVVLGLAEQRIGFEVDEVLDEQEVLVKPLRRPLSRVRHIAGATVLGTGRVAPVLSVTDLLKSARQFGRPGSSAAPGAVTPVAPGAKWVLVVDDSATSRMLIKGMLESAGYKVTTAVDGLEAFARLREQKFDLLVSDVEMPRLNGFDLTLRVRADKKLAELPVVLVTARETREDREHGIDVGASAYIVKSSLDESNLLDAVRRLA